MQRFVDFIATKRGLAKALHSGDPAYSALPAYFDKHLRPVLDGILANAIAEGAVRPGIQAGDLLRAVSTLCQGSHGEGTAYAKRMVGLIIDGLRYGAGPQGKKK
jgi:hypothetical protein